LSRRICPDWPAPAGGDPSRRPALDNWREATLQGGHRREPRPDRAHTNPARDAPALTLAALGQALLSGALAGCFYALVALGFSIVLGVSRALNLAHGELVVLGGYVGYWLWTATGVSPLLLAPVAAVALLPLALVWQWLLARIPEPVELNSLALTFGLGLLLQTAMRALWRSDYRLIADPMLAASIVVGPIHLNLGRVIVAAAALAAVALLWLGLTRTRHGRAVRASSIDAHAAALLGIDVDRARRTAFLIAGALAGGAGVLFATLHYLTPAAGVELTLIAIVLTIWAGVGRLRSVLAAGVVLGLVEAVGVGWAGPRWRETIVAALLLGSLLARAGGLARGVVAAR
jgi:branched-chain amino acid transport system permease protein